MNPDAMPPAPVGTPVHFRNGAGVCRAAVVTEVPEGAAEGVRHLRVHHQAELADRRDVPFAGSTMPGAWNKNTPNTWHLFDLTSPTGC